jgi:hypothetical protein
VCREILIGLAAFEVAVTVIAGDGTTSRRSPMNEHYVLRIRGLLGPLLRITFRELQCRPVPCQTTIAGPLSDDALRDLLTRLDESGLELLHLERSREGSFPPDEPRTRPVIAGWPQP